MSLLSRVSVSWRMTRRPPRKSMLADIVVRSETLNNLKKRRIMKARTIRMNKVRKAIASVYHVSNAEAQEMVPMFVRKAA
jgi:hypothetical protein